MSDQVPIITVRQAVLPAAIYSVVLGVTAGTGQQPPGVPGEI